MPLDRCKNPVPFHLHVQADKHKPNTIGKRVRAVLTVATLRERRLGRGSSLFSLVQRVEGDGLRNEDARLRVAIGRGNFQVLRLELSFPYLRHL